MAYELTITRNNDWLHAQSPARTPSAKNRGSRMKVFATVAYAEEWLGRTEGENPSVAGISSEF